MNVPVRGPSLFSAHKFCSRHKASFEDNASEQQVVEQLQRLHTKDDILSSRKATEFK